MDCNLWLGPSMMSNNVLASPDAPSFSRACVGLFDVVRRPCDDHGSSGRGLNFALDQECAVSGFRTCSRRNPKPTIRAGIRCRIGTAPSNRSGQGGVTGPVAPSARRITRSCIRDLQALDDPRRQLAALLHRREHVVGAPRPAPRSGADQDVGGGDRVLDGEVDADAADRRHRVRRVADAEQAGLAPALQPVDARPSAA